MSSGCVCFPFLFEVILPKKKKKKGNENVTVPKMANKKPLKSIFCPFFSAS